VLLLGVLALTLAFAGSAWAAFTPARRASATRSSRSPGTAATTCRTTRLTCRTSRRRTSSPGTAAISATATQDLSRFDLDLRGFTISQLEVDGRAATFTRDGQELVVTPRTGIHSGSAFTVVVGYAGHADCRDRSGLLDRGLGPDRRRRLRRRRASGLAGLYPANDNPRDKATYDFSVSVPAGLTVMANGVLVSHATAHGRTTWVWHEADPMAPYLSTATLGRFDLTISTAGGVPSYVASDPQLPTGNVLRKLPEIIDYYSSIFGPYPFTAVGAIVDSARVVGYSLETQTKPVFDRMPDETTLAHEQSHMWFGDSVTLTEWP
jgi:aminopeptidase N